MFSEVIMFTRDAMILLVSSFGLVAAGNGWLCGSPLTEQSNGAAVVKSAYAKLKNTFLQTIDAEKCCIKRPGQSNDCVSEGVGYAMLLAAYQSDEPTFRCMWSFAKAHFDGNGLMNWRIGPDGSIWGSHSALDGDEDMAYALIVACDNFGSGDLCQDAPSLIRRLALYEIDGTKAPKPGDNWGGCDDSNPAVNPSYFSPGYYSRFGTTTDDQDTWKAVASRSYDIIERIAHNSTGLLTDWSDCEGLGAAAMCGQYADAHCKDFYYDAARAAWRLSVAAAWSCDARALTGVKKMLSFFGSIGGPGNVREGYSVDGTPLYGQARLHLCSRSCLPAPGRLCSALPVDLSPRIASIEPRPNGLSSALADVLPTPHRSPLLCPPGIAHPSSALTQDRRCFLAMASTLFVHHPSESVRAQWWQALVETQPTDYYCASLR